MAISADSIDSLFSSTYPQQDQFANLAQIALSRGADLYTNGNPDGAIREFRRAIGLNSSSDNVTQAYDLIATVYLQQNKPEDAIKAYKASIAMASSNDSAHIKLGNIYFGQGRYSEAESEYKAAVRISPTSSANMYSLGQAYLAEGKNSDAESQFNRVLSMEPNHYGSSYALGQTYSKEGRYGDAIAQFQKTIGLKSDFYNAYVDLGYAYADVGQTDKAQEQLKVLNDKAPDKASVLSSYITKVTSPKILTAYNISGFVDTLGPGTPLTSMNSSFSAPNASKEFNMVFVFSKNMDAGTVQNLFNWSISRSPNGASGGAYNWGRPVPSTEAPIMPVPLSVVYLPESNTATVSFMVKQNAAGNGTIDPSHITFKFSGKDAYGNAMDKSADEYNGISKIV